MRTNVPSLKSVMPSSFGTVASSFVTCRAKAVCSRRMTIQKCFITNLYDIGVLMITV